MKRILLISSVFSELSVLAIVLLFAFSDTRSVQSLTIFTFLFIPFLFWFRRDRHDVAGMLIAVFVVMFFLKTDRSEFIDRIMVGGHAFRMPVASLILLLGVLSFGSKIYLEKKMFMPWNPAVRFFLATSVSVIAVMAVFYVILNRDYSMEFRSHYRTFFIDLIKFLILFILVTNVCVKAQSRNRIIACMAFVIGISIIAVFI